MKISKVFLDHKGVEHEINLTAGSRLNHFTELEIIILTRIASHIERIAESQKDLPANVRFTYKSDHDYSIDKKRIKVYFSGCQNLSNKVFEELEAENQQLMNCGGREDNPFRYPAITSASFYGEITNDGKKLKDVLVVQYERPEMLTSINSGNMIDPAFISKMSERYHARSSMTDPARITKEDLDPLTKAKISAKIDEYMANNTGSEITNKNREIYDHIFSACFRAYKNPSIDVISSDDRILSLMVTGRNILSVSWDFMLTMKRIEDQYKRYMSIEVIIKTPEINGKYFSGNSTGEKKIETVCLIVNLIKISPSTGKEPLLPAPSSSSLGYSKNLKRNRVEFSNEEEHFHTQGDEESHPRKVAKKVFPLSQSSFSPRPLSFTTNPHLSSAFSEILKPDSRRHTVTTVSLENLESGSEGEE